MKSKSKASVLAILSLALVLASLIVAFGNKTSAADSEQLALEEDPIQRLDEVDVIAERNDGSVDLYIVISSYLSDSNHHKRLLETKIYGYLTAIQSEYWSEKYGHGKSTIVIAYDVLPHQKAMELVDQMRKRSEFSNIGIRFESLSLESKQD